MNEVLPVVIAGGASSRYGSPKALVEVGGVRVVDRVSAALRAATNADVVAIVNDTSLAEAISLPHRPDILRDAGALAGVHAALLWAQELGCNGILAAACDMPFLNAGLLREIADNAAHNDVVVPESCGRRGIEPLCAFYAMSCIAPIERAIARGDARMISFHNEVRVARIPLERVAVHGNLEHLFRNLNTPEDRALAERLLAHNVA